MIYTEEIVREKLAELREHAVTRGASMAINPDIGHVDADYDAVVVARAVAMLNEGEAARSDG